MELKDDAAPSFEEHPGSPENASDGTLEEALTSLDSDTIIPAQDTHSIPVVGIGGSAGSIPFLQEFFAHIAPDTGMAYVVVLHLSPEHESTLASVLQHSCKIPVRQVQNRTKVEANHAYVIPPGKHLSMVDGSLNLNDFDRAPGKRVAVDLFFRTLADTHGPRARAIVLSGNDSDGAIGIKRIKERGGLTVAQDPNEAQFDGMPRSAIATGMIDWILPVSEMPSRLVSYQQNESRVRLPSEEEPPEPARPARHESESILQQILAFLRTSTGRDFSYYKRATVLRRIGRRMQVNDVVDLTDYLDFLRTHPGETGALLQDLLISVTNFFRDGDSFRVLEEIIPKLFEGKDHSDQIRVWVAACATGEEAYSVAMLLCEHALKLDAPPQIQVFATDIDEHAINAAREGIYPETIAADVSEERLRRFFSREHGLYRVKRPLRESVLFALHDVLKDSPFSRLDLVCCRNFLIYLNRSAQNRVFETFHFALRPEGRLFLGSSESIEEGGPLFSPLDKKHRLYLRRPFQRAGLPLSSASTSLSQVLRAQQRAFEKPTIPLSAFSIPGKGPALELSPAVPVKADNLSWSDLHFQLIERLSPPSLLVDRNSNIIHLSEHAGRYLEITGGEPTMNLLRLVNPMLRLDLRAALFRAAKTNSPVFTKGITVEIEGKSLLIDLTVEPGPASAQDIFLVVFTEQALDSAEVTPLSAPDASLNQLEHELESVKLQLRGTVEQYEVGSEELKASNEELQAMNEELRSATEELETSREELQSINEELTSVNQELKSKIEEISRANNDLQNLMSSTNIATIFLDRDLQIKRYTPSSVPLFNLIPTDLGRPLTDLTFQLTYPSLAADAARVLEELTLIEREVPSHDGRWFLARLLPYRTPQDHIGGVVLTFIDISQRKLVEKSLQRSQENLGEELHALEDLHEMTTRLLNTSNLATTLEEVLHATTKFHGTDLGSVHLYDKATHRLNLVASTGFAPAFSQKKQVIDLTRPSLYHRALATGRPVFIENLAADRDFASSAQEAASFGYQAKEVTPLLTRSGELLGMMTTYFRQPRHLTDRDLQRMDLYARQAADLIERKRAEEALLASDNRIQAIVKQSPAGICQIDLSGHFTFVNTKLCTLLDYTEQELLGKHIQQITHPADWERSKHLFGMLVQDGIPYEIEKRALRKNGSSVGVNVSLDVVRNDEQKPQSVLASFTNITERQASEHALKEALRENQAARDEVEAAAVAKDQFLAILSHELRTPLTPVLVTVGSLCRRNDIPQRVRDGLEMIRRNVQIEAHFIDDLLDVTLITRNKFEIVRHPMDVHEQIQGAVEISEADIQAKDQVLSLSLEATRHSINGDPARLQQVIWNLLKNSSKFTPRGGKIHVATRNEGDCILVICSDTGTGIETDVLPHIFQAFTQGGASVAREFGGLGLGLAISKATVDAHGGTLQAASHGRNKGAIFTVTLPLS